VCDEPYTTRTTIGDLQPRDRYLLPQICALPVQFLQNGLFVGGMLFRPVLTLTALLFGCAQPVEPVLVQTDVQEPGNVEPSSELERAAVQIWALDAQHGHCGGFMLTSNVVVTAAHCVPSGSTDVLFRRLGSNQVDSARVNHLDRDEARDIAYLSADQESPVHLGARKLKNGEHGTLLRPLWGTRISGSVEVVRFDDGVERAVLWGAGAHGGDSGSPVVADDGSVIGIVSSGVWSAPGEPITGVTLVPVPTPPSERPR
jgi:hypothetical protein